jgi:hypothetical protein
MRYLTLVLLGITFFSCSSQKIINEKKKIQLNEQSEKELYPYCEEALIKDEKDIVNDLLQTELTSDRYKGRENQEKVLIEEANSPITPLLAYEHAFKEWHDSNKTNLNKADVNNRWFLDSLQINELKNRLKNDIGCHWKSTDILFYKVAIISQQSFADIIKNGNYINMPEKIILIISKPLIIDKNKALISFNSGSSIAGFNTIERFTVLMKKINGKWIKDTYYFDGAYE